MELVNDSTKKDDLSFKLGYKLSGSLDKPSQTALKLNISEFVRGKMQRIAVSFTKIAKLDIPSKEQIQY
jgi:hypothetical protein